MIIIYSPMALGAYVIMQKPQANGPLKWQNVPKKVPTAKIKNFYLKFIFKDKFLYLKELENISENFQTVLGMSPNWIYT